MRMVSGETLCTCSSRWSLVHVHVSITAVCSRTCLQGTQARRICAGLLLCFACRAFDMSAKVEHCWACALDCQSVSQGMSLLVCRFQMHRFEAAVNIDALLGAVRDYFERVTREFHVKGPGGGPQQPRDVEVSKRSHLTVPPVFGVTWLSGCCAPAVERLRLHPTSDVSVCRRLSHWRCSWQHWQPGKRTTLGGSRPSRCMSGWHAGAQLALLLKLPCISGRMLRIATLDSRMARGLVMYITSMLCAEPVSEAVVHSGGRRRCGALLHWRRGGQLRGAPAAAPAGKRSCRQ